MFNCKSAVAACGVVLGMLVAVASVHAWDSMHRTASLTFSGPVRVPGVTLAAGTYVFEVADPDSSNVVRVRAQDYRSVYFQGFARRIDRPAGLPADRRVVLGEAAAGIAPPIIAWYPGGGASGLEFIYHR